MSILVVDDRRTNLALLEFLLRAHGHEVHTAVDAESMFAAIAKQKPQLILMDVQLPVIDGLELTRRIKANPATADIIVVAVTAYAMSGDEQLARAAGCDAYVSKPINTQTLPQLIAKFLDGK
jgi:two-component system cell cycle response regulator DivK